MYYWYYGWHYQDLDDKTISVFKKKYLRNISGDGLLASMVKLLVVSAIVQPYDRHELLLHNVYKSLSRESDWVPVYLPNPTYKDRQSKLLSFIYWLISSQFYYGTIHSFISLSARDINYRIPCSMMNGLEL